MRHTQRGFSLIELMIAVTLGLVAVAAVGSVFIYGSRNYKQDDKLSRLQDELRFAMAQLTQDLEMTGFYAQVRDLETDIDVDVSATISNDCGPRERTSSTPALWNTWTYHNREASIFMVGNASPGQAALRFPCIDPAEFQPNTDVVAIKRLSGVTINGPDPLPTTFNNQLLLRTNGVDHRIYKQLNPSSPPAPGGTITAYQYQPVVWFVRRYAFPAQNPPVPSLCRKFLNGNGSGEPRMDTECLAQGVETMHLEFGFDTDRNGVVDFFDPVADMTLPADYPRLRQIIAVRVFLLGRSSEKDPLYTNVKTYTLGQDGAFSFDDGRGGYYRKLLSSVVLLRNPSNRLTPYELPQ